MTKQNIILNAQTRDLTGKKVSALREDKKIPAVLYGHKIKNHNLVLDCGDFEKLFNKISESDLVDLKINNKKTVKVLIQETQRNPITNNFLHIDFYQVKMDEKIKTEIELEFVNESPAVKDLNGVLIKALDHIEIECLPGDLISKIQIDLSTLKTFDDIIRVNDLNISEKIKILTNKETIIALVEEQKEEEKPIEENETEGEKETSEEKDKDKKSEQSPVSSDQVDKKESDK